MLRTFKLQIVYQEAQEAQEDKTKNTFSSSPLFLSLPALPGRESESIFYQEGQEEQVDKAKSIIFQPPFSLPGLPG